MTGKWSRTDVPHSGWVCNEVTDLEEPSAICEMCETQEIRYVHHMTHLEYPTELKCGCICAGNMEEDLVGAKTREKRMRNHFGRKQRWLTRTWNISQLGNSYINDSGYNIVIYQLSNDGWGIFIRDRSTDYVVASDTNGSVTFDDARRRSFELVQKLKSGR